MSIREMVDAVLALADELHTQAIARLFERRDLEVEVETLRRWGRKGKGGRKPGGKKP